MCESAYAWTCIYTKWKIFFFPKLEMQDLTILCLSNTKKTMLPLCTTGDQICNALFKTKALPVLWGVASGLGRRQQGLLFFRIHNQLYVIEIQIRQKVYWSRNAHFISEKKERIRCYNQCFLLIGKIKRGRGTMGRLNVTCNINLFTIFTLSRTVFVPDV